MTDVTVAQEEKSSRTGMFGAHRLFPSGIREWQASSGINGRDEIDLPGWEVHKATAAQTAEKCKWLCIH